MSPYFDDPHPPVGPGTPAVPPAPPHSLHGPERTPEPAMTGLHNEVWSYGEAAYPIPRDYLHVGERQHVRDAADAGAEVAL
ncbi:hypothetical protein ACWEWG_15725 [Streptomyces sp. NPDC003758]